MALTLADRVKETTTTSGNGTVTLLGASTGYQSFAIIGNGNTTYYCIANQGTNEWEVGIGTYTASGTTLARTTVLSNSSATEPSALVFSAGIKDVFVTYPSEKSVNLDASGNATALGTPVAFTGTNITGTAASLTAGAATVLATARTIAGVSFNGSANIAIPLSNLSDVSIDTPVVNQLLGYNGTVWGNVAPNPASAGTGVVFYNATPVITATGANNDVAILTFASIPVTTAEQVITGTAVSNTVLFSAFVTVALNRLIFDAGIYDFTIWAGVDSIAGGSVTTITRQIYTATPFVVGTVTTTGTGSSRTATASSGTPFATSVIDASATNTVASYLQTPQGLYQITARASDTVVTITTPSGYTNESAVAGTVWKKLFGITTPEITSISPNYTVFDVVTTQPSTVVTAATKMGILGFVTSDATRTISLTYNGEDRNTHVNTPLANLHNDLAGLQGGTATEYFHSTSAEYTGTGTGVFVREAGPTMTTPTLGVATATSINKVAFTTPATGSTLTIANGKTLTASNTLILAGVDGKTLTTNNNLTLTGTDGITAAFGGGLAIAATKVLTSSNTLTLTGTDGITAAFGGGLAIAAAKILTASNTLTFNGTDASTVAFGTGGTVAYTANNLSVFASTTSAQFAGVLSDGTGEASGLVVFNNAPTIINPTTSAGTATVPSLTLTSGTNLTSIVSGTVEYDGTNAYFTQNSAGKRGVINSSPQYVLSSNGTALAATISPFFTSGATIPLLANSNYVIEAFCFFLKTTAGTAVWTNTLSGAATLMHSTLEYTPVTGFTTALISGAMVLAETTQGTVTTMAFPATVSLTTAVNHIAKIKLWVTTSAAVNYTLNLTQGAGTATPLAGSWQKVTLVKTSTY